MMEGNDRLPRAVCSHGQGLLALGTKIIRELDAVMGMETRNTAEDAGSAVDLYWIPLGAGQHVVRLSGRLYEAICARLQRRPPCDLYHSALVVVVPKGRFVIEQTQVPGRGGPRGVV